MTTVDGPDWQELANNCLALRQERDDLKAEVERLRAVHVAELGVCEPHCDTVRSLRAEARKLMLESVSARCRRLRVQCCMSCEDMACCDNTSPARVEFDRLRAIEQAAREWLAYQNMEMTYGSYVRKTIDEILAGKGPSK